MRGVVSAILLLFVFAALGQTTFKGRVVKIVDGDTYDLLLANKTTVRIRMFAIDAPERGMAFYQVAKNYLGQLCFDKEVSMERVTSDRNGRIVGKTFLPDGREVGLEMLKAGMAWHFKRYDKTKSYADAEATARKKKSGLWGDANPVAPWDMRKMRHSSK